MSDFEVPASHADLLTMTVPVVLATATGRGAPNASPVWFDWDGHRVRVSLTTTRKKYRNLVANPAVALSFADPDDPYRTMEVRGEVVAIERDPDGAFVDALARRYMGIERYGFDPPGTERVVVVIAPRRAFPWS